MNKDRGFKMHDGKTGAAIAVRITPRASRNEISEILNDGTVKIRLTAPPVEGAANQALVKFLSEILDIPQTNIDIVAGQTGRDKLVTIVNMDSGDVQTKILAHLA